MVRAPYVASAVAHSMLIFARLVGGDVVICISVPALHTPAAMSGPKTQESCHKILIPLLGLTSVRHLVNRLVNSVKKAPFPVPAFRNT